MGVVDRGAGGGGGLATPLDFPTNAGWNLVLSLPVSQAYQKTIEGQLGSF